MSAEIKGDVCYLDVGSERNVAHRLVNPELVSYPVEQTVIERGKEVVKITQAEFMVCTAVRVKQS